MVKSGAVQKFIPGQKLETIHNISVKSDRCDLSEALISDVPVALAYSGGVDSSVLYGIYSDKVDKISIGLLPKHAIVINTSRGSIIDDDALIYALENKSKF